MSRVAETLEVSRSQLHARASGSPKARGPYRKMEDAELLPAIRPPRRPATDLRLPAPHGAAEPRAAQPWVGADQPQAGAAHPRPARPDAGAIHRPPRGPHPRRQGRRDGVEPALVFGRLGDRLLERRTRPHRLHHRCLRPRDHRPRCGGGRRYLRLRRPRHDARRRRATLQGRSGPAPGRASFRQRHLLHRQGHPRLRHRTRARSLLHADQVTGKQRHERVLRQNPQARLRPRHAVCTTPPPHSGSSPDGSTTTTRSILIPRSACARPSRSAKRSTPAGLSGETGGTPRIMAHPLPKASQGHASALRASPSHRRRPGEVRLPPLARRAAPPCWSRGRVG